MVCLLDTVARHYHNSLYHSAGRLAVGDIIIQGRRVLLSPCCFLCHTSLLLLCVCVCAVVLDCQVLCMRVTVYFLASVGVSLHSLPHSTDNAETTYFGSVCFVGVKAS